jgi:hypothetical protein
MGFPWYRNTEVEKHVFSLLQLESKQTKVHRARGGPGGGRECTYNPFPLYTTFRRALQPHPLVGASGCTRTMLTGRLTSFCLISQETKTNTHRILPSLAGTCPAWVGNMDHLMPHLWEEALSSRSGLASVAWGQGGPMTIWYLWKEVCKRPRNNLSFTHCHTQSLMLTLSYTHIYSHS